jgi:thiol-disulfide isomerase/thioredoxin
MKKIVLSLCIIIFASSCQEKIKVPTGDFSIHGQVKDADTLIFEIIEADKLILVDTVFAVNGEFILANSIDKSSFFLLRTPQGEGINLLIKKNEQIEVSGEKTNWKSNYSIIGSEGSIKIKELNNKLEEFKYSLDLIYEEAKRAKKEDYIDIQNKFITTFSSHKEYLKNFIKQNIASKVCILALFQAIKKENILNLIKDFDVYIKVYESFSEKWPESSHTALLSEIIKMAYAPEFEMIDNKGENFSLSNFKEQITIIDFWASWCKPCREKSPLLRNLYSKYHSRGLEIVSVSLDGTPQQKNPEDDWKKAIEKDQKIWPQTSELKGWESQIRNTYNVTSIPHTLLINKNGRIIGQNLEPEELEETIVTLLNL